MAKKKTKTPAEPRRPVDEDGFPLPEGSVVTPAAPAPELTPRPTGGSTMKKVDAVRAALAEGVENPPEGVAYIKKKFGIEMSPGSFSTSKFQIAKAKGEPKVAAVAVPKAHRAPKAGPSPNGHDSMGGSPAELARAVKALVTAHGVDAVKSMADVFGD